ncbi:4'-phosphopantetheinyl transferase superfamily protein [Motilimonas sp. E26]|uniref:4'-phosphopantetheinyl transferase family protein n=1 Tax=Motilimonas sp. E26 TaxID=2865674 RepID=UPI001E4779E6|nr:4'-phosphopantetheinyl transferase superfamily protein [Motilimonas sp. E26]MCE0556855.1 4'-phosphopantetheinyl transferase superfamily protein [Motilimonas sp. E26]
MTYMSELQVRTLAEQSLWQCSFKVQAYRDEHAQLLNVTLPNALQHAVPKRKAEFVAGRAVALAALQSVGCDRVDIPIGEHRAPVWPHGWSGSISHTDELAIAIIRPSSKVSLLGVDVENLIAATQVGSLMPLFVSAKERKLLAATQLSLPAFATLIFSAKESIFKAVYPYVKTYLEFSDAMLIGVDMSKREAYFKLCARGEALFGSALTLSVHFLFEDGKVYTLVCAK